LVVVLAVISLLESTILSTSEWDNYRPDLFLLVVLFLALGPATRSSYLGYWLAGLLKDLFSSGRFGINALLLLLAGCVAEGMRNRVFSEHWLTRAILALVFALGTDALTRLVWARDRLFESDILSAALTTAVLAPFVFWLLGKCRLRAQSEP
jgi:rod shape-determining protein MreD